MWTDAVIVRAGLNSHHPAWFGAERRFHLIVSAHTELPPHLLAGADEAVLLPGPKVASWRRLFAERPDILSRHRQIALLDDDLICTAADINACFEAGRQHGLSLWQPSLSWDSYFSYGITLHNPLFKLRYVNFVEMMCAFFSADQLGRVLPLLSLGYEVNIDRLWCRLSPAPHQAYAILDAVQFRHTRPVGQNAAAQGFARDPTRRGHNMYQAEIDRIEQELGVFFRGPVAYAGITRNGWPIQGRLAMAAAALPLLLARRRRVNDRFYRPVLDHIRHNLTRPVVNAPLAAGELTGPMRPGPAR